MTSLTACLISEDKGHLKAELQNLRRKGALRASADFDSTTPDPDRTCGRCRTELGRVINRGAYCRACRLKVCKGCREYSFRTTDWVCTVCHKHMEIQAASGEWMNEFVRRPSRRRDNRVYVPAADIIKRTIRRSWTISNPTPRWTSIRGSPELRPYNSLPRGQDINNYPSLALHQTNLKNQQLSADMPSPPYRRKSPTRRTQSEDVYGERSLSVERGPSPFQPSPSPRSVSPGYLSNISPAASTNLTSSGGSDQSSAFPIFERPVRVNPLMVLAESRQKEKNISPKMKKKESTVREHSPVEETDETNKPGLSPEPTLKLDKSIEKRVSFDSNITNKLIPEKSVSVLRTQSLTENRYGKERQPIFVNRSFGGEDHIDDASVIQEVQNAKEDSGPVELCDIEPLSGTVFRKVTVRRRAEKIRKVPAIDTGLDFLLPEGDDYKLVFISSDSSSKEEDVDDNDSSSTASSFPIDECDWDYFEPGAGAGSGTKHHSTLLSWNSPFGSPRVYRRSIIESPLGSPIVYRRRRTRESDTGTDEDTTRFDSGSPASSDSLFHARISSEEPLDPLRPTEKFNEEQSAALQCLHSEENQQKVTCQSCGASTQYIPIPIPVPVPFPVPAIWTGQDAITLYGSQNLDQTISNSRLRVLPRSLWPYIGQAALILPLINANAGEQFSTPHSVLHNNKSECEASTTMPVAVDRDNSQLETACSSKTDAEQVSEGNKEDEAVATDIIEANEEITGYLECENRYVSSSDFSRDSSDSGDTSGDQKPKIRRVYIVNGGESRQSDDALPSSNVTSDEEGRNSHSSVREDDMSSSGSADTDSDDTGTVADQKPKRFSRIFVVNKNLSSSSHESTGSSDSDTSDNDTDTEMDCTVILTNIKSLDDENCTSALEDGDKINDTINQGCDKQSGDNISEELDNIVSTDKANKEHDAKESEYMSSSPGLSDVSAESLNSSDVDQVRNYANNNEVGKRFAEVLQKELSKVNSNKINKDNDSLGNKRKELYLTKKLLNNDELLNNENKEYEKSSSYIIDNIDEQKCNDNIQGNDKIDTKSLPVIEKLNIQDGGQFHSESDLQKISAVFLETVLNEPRLLRNVSPIQTCNYNTAVSLETVLTDNKKSVMFTERAMHGNNEEKTVHTLGDNASNIDHNGDGIPESLNKNVCEKIENETDRTDTVAVAVDSEFLSETSSKAVDPEPGEWNQIRSSEEGRAANTRERQPGEPAVVSSENLARHAARYTSLVMITQDPAPNYQQVSVVTSDTTTLVQDNEVIVHHTNWQDQGNNRIAGKLHNDKHQHNGESVTVITGGETLSAFEEGLADDDSWVENLSCHDDDDDDDDDFGTNSPTDDSSSGEEVTLTCSSAIDQEDELRGYHRSAIDFTLHTIVEESCEESEIEQNATKKKERPASATDLEKYFFFGLGDGTVPSINSNREDGFSETSSIYSEGMESLGGPEDNSQPNDNNEPAELASSRLEKYFLSGFMGFTAERRDSDGSVGSDSEGRPSPEQRRKRLVRARGTGRSHSSSLDNLDNAGNEQITETQMNSEDSSSSDSETYDEINSFEKPDGQFDTIKRKKGKKKAITVSSEEIRNLETPQEIDENDNESDDDEDGHKTPQPEIVPASTNLTSNKNQQSRDSGFIGSCDDLLKEQRDNITPELPLGKSDLRIELEDITEEKKADEKITNLSTPPATTLTRKDSFNNWSSDEETNLMMCKMRQFFKTMVANSQCNNNSKPGTPNMSSRMSPKPLASPRMKSRCKPPQLVYFENELTRLMKTVPGIREDQVREIVEYLSSEDTWSDSYDSSDYTSSDLEGTGTKTALQQQISDSCKQIISKFDNSIDDEGDEGDGGIIDESHGLNKETAFVYQKLVASFEKMATGDSCASVSKLTPHNSPPLIAKVMHHIGSRLVALMHEVSSGESHASNSPKTKHYHRRLQHKISSASSTTTEDDGPDIGNHDTLGGFEETSYNLLPRSRSHDLLVGETRTLNQSSGGVSDITEEREASDCERFSWRGSFESALLATDSRNKLSLLGGEASASASAIAAKRRSAGDLLFSHKSLSREQLDRVRSCGSIGGGNSEDKLWVASATRPNKRRSSVPDASCGSGGSADGEDEDEEIETRSTLPRSLQTGVQTTNSLPRLPTNTASSMQKSQSMYHFLPQNVKSARYRPPGLSRLTSVPKRAVSAPGLQPSHQRRGRRSQQQNVPSDDVALSEAHSSPMLATRSNSKSATPSPVAPSSRRNTGSVSSQEWQPDDDIDRLVGFHGRSSLSSLGLRSDSMASVYSGAGEGRYGSVAVRGQVEFGLQFNYKAGALEIMIKQCRDLAPVDAKRNRSDPYVKVYLLPDKSKSGKRKTKVKKHTLNPVFDECLKFHISLNGLEMRTLWLTVWHSDMFGRNDFLGEVMMALENKVFDDPTPKWYNLQERTEPFEDFQSYKGDIIVCLKFVPPDMTMHKKGKRSRGALHVLVKEAKSLTAVKANGTSDPFCKSYLLPDKGRSSKQKTPVARRTINPVWNYTFVYDDVTLQELAERCLELTVWDHDRLASNEFLGGVRFSLGTGKHYGKPVEWMDATGKEHSLWKSMLERPNFWVEGCVSLRPTLDTRTL